MNELAEAASGISSPDSLSPEAMAALSRRTAELAAANQKVEHARQDNIRREAEASVKKAEEAQSNLTGKLKEAASQAGETVAPAEALSPSSSPPKKPDPDDQARVGPDGKPLKDDPNRLKLVGEIAEEPLEAVMAKINRMIGCDDFKAWINTLYASRDSSEMWEELKKWEAENGEARSDAGEDEPPFYHMVLVGDPGTGKSTEAEYYCQFLRSAGIMKGARFFKITAGNIVSQFIGATARELKEILQQGKDTGQKLILHIDEAYSLTSNSFGMEAVTELVNSMTEEAGRIVIVMTGYKDPMNEMLNKNEGMRSRVRKYVDNKSYSDAELLEIFKLKLGLQKKKINLGSGAEEEILKFFSAIRKSAGKNFGNGREAQVLLQNLNIVLDARIAGMKKSEGLTKDVTSKFTAADWKALQERMRSYTVEDIKAAAAFRMTQAHSKAEEALTMEEQESRPEKTYTQAEVVAMMEQVRNMTLLQTIQMSAFNQAAAGDDNEETVPAAQESGPDRRLRQRVKLEP